MAGLRHFQPVFCPFDGALGLDVENVSDLEQHAVQFAGLFADFNHLQGQVRQQRLRAKGTRQGAAALDRLGGLGDLRLQGAGTGVFAGEMGYVYGGCGIVGESDADAEYEEIDLKLRTILSAFGA